MKALRWNRSMRARMTLAFTLCIGVLLAIADVSLIESSRYSAQRSAERLLAQSARELQQELREPASPPLSPQQFTREEGNELHERGVIIFLVDKAGHVIVAPKKNASTELTDSDVARRKAISFGEYSLVLALAPNRKAQEMREFTAALLGLSTLILAASALGAWLLVGRVLAPLEALSSQAQTALVSESGARLCSPSDDLEMTHLVATLNGLLARLEASAQTKARFYAAASHELRTPLQSLNGFLELGLSRERSREEYRAALEEAQTQSRNLSTLVSDLLKLNQLEAATSQPPHDEVDPADVASRALQKLQGQTTQNNLRIALDAAESRVLRAPWSHVEMLIGNLMENAVKYATPGSTVRVLCTTSNFEVYNACAPTEDWDDEKVLEPFFRPDASRNSQTGGNGLGLAICKAICQTNDWRLSIRQISGGVEARITFSEEAKSPEAPLTFLPEKASLPQPLTISQRSVSAR
jgi:signal transduction histidine kinase